MLERDFDNEFAVAKGANSLDALDWLSLQLDTASGSWIRMARIKIAVAKQGVKSGKSKSAYKSNFVVLSKYGIELEFGRPLYSYKITDDIYNVLEVDLKNLRLNFKNKTYTDFDAAIFALWAAERFRRTYKGGLLRWQDFGAPLGVTLEQADWRRLADRGLSVWGIPELKRNGAHLRLVAIARQGGFPVAAATEAGGWAKKFLKRIVEQLLAIKQPTQADADNIAESLKSDVPSSWYSEELKAVSSELALAIASLRREAEEDGCEDGALVADWLDRARPNWRDTLPVSLSEGGAAQLVDELIKVERLKGGRGQIHARRQIVCVAGEWREQVQLIMDGHLSSGVANQDFKKLATEWTRLRVYASGETARYIATELAVAEPEEDGTWSCMASRSKLTFDVPSGVAIKVEMRGEGTRVAGPFTISGGEACQSDIKVCEAGEHDGDNRPIRLEILGKGSGSYRAEPLFVEVPQSWKVVPKDVDASARVLEEYGRQGRALWEVVADCLVQSSEGDCYLIRAGQQGELKDQILLSGNRPEKLDSLEGYDVYCGLPRVTVTQGGVRREPQFGEIVWRTKRGGVWQPWRSGAPLGLCEVAWRDVSTRHIRAKCEAVFLPAEFKLEMEVRADWVSLNLSGWPGSASGYPAQSMAQTNCWRFNREHSDQSHFELTLDHPKLETPIRLKRGFQQRAWFYDWQGKKLAPNKPLALGDLKKYVARSAETVSLWAELLDENRKPIRQANARWTVVEELSLSVIADDVARLLRSIGRLDSVVRLDFHDSYQTHWYVSEFGHKLEEEARGFVAVPAIEDQSARLVARAFGRPWDEIDLEPYGAHELRNHRPVWPGLKSGPWLIYLRSNEAVLCRPRVYCAAPADHHPQTRLGKVMILGKDEVEPALDALIDSVVADPDTDESREVVRSIIDLATSLNGVPVSTYLVFKQLVRQPMLGPLMLYGAKNDEIEDILHLSDSLFFEWFLIPRRYWDAAWNKWGNYYARSVPEKYISMIVEKMGQRRLSLIAHNPTINCLLLGAVGDDNLPSLVQEFLNRSIDRIRDDITNPFRPIRNGLLPNWQFNQRFWRAIDAPLVAAMVAREEIAFSELTREELLAIKDISRQHPRYFSAAFNAKFSAK